VRGAGEGEGVSETKNKGKRCVAKAVVTYVRACVGVRLQE
jgi:hypothetical protein